MNDKEFLRQADQKAWEKYKAVNENAGTAWDYVIITASNASQGNGFKAQIQERLAAGQLPTSTHYGIVPDPEGERVGNGGAVLGALRYVLEREGHFDGLKILVILSSGDSRRVAQYSAVGKIFSPVPRVLPNGRASTLFDEAMIVLSPIPERIHDGVLIISGDVMLAFDATQFEPKNSDAAAIAFPEPAATGAGHGVFLSNEKGNIARVWHKQKPEALKEYGAVDSEGNVNIDTGAVYFSPEVAKSLCTLICDKQGVCSDISFRKIVNGYLAPSLYVDFFYPLAEESTYDGYLKEIPEGKMSEALLQLREQIWNVLRPFRIKLCRIAPSRFIHFGSTGDVEELMSDGIEEYNYLGWQRQIQSIGTNSDVAAYSSIAEGIFGRHVYLEDSIIHSTAIIGDRVILSGVELNGGIIPSDVVLHCLKLTDGSYVTRIYGIHDNPKSAQVQLFGQTLDLGNVWHAGEEENLWNARIYPACENMEASIQAALNLYAITHEKGSREDWAHARKESLYSSFCMADGSAIQKWQQYVKRRMQKHRGDL